MGSDVPPHVVNVPENDISIHAPVWGATHARGCQRAARNPFQSTLPRGERHTEKHCFVRLLAISIHAPAWGATDVSALISKERYISIHAPAWGATVSEGCLSSPQAISIHAPAWGATWICPCSLKGEIISIHAPAWGATTYSKLINKVSLFQSTLPRGERQVGLLMT